MTVWQIGICYQVNKTNTTLGMCIDHYR